MELKRAWNILLSLLSHVARRHRRARRGHEGEEGVPGRAAPVELQGRRGGHGRGQEDGQRPECPLKEEDGFRHVAPHFEGRRNL